MAKRNIAGGKTRHLVINITKTRSDVAMFWEQLI